MSDGQQQIRILVVTGPRTRRLVAAGIFEAFGTVQEVDTPDAALERLAEGRYDVVIAPTTQIIPLARSAGHLRTENFLEEIGQSALVVGRDGDLVWANAKLRSSPPEIQDGLRAAAHRALLRLADQIPAPAAEIIREQLSLANRHFFDLTLTARRDAEGRPEQVVALAWDVTENKNLQDKLDAIDNAGRELVGLDAESLGKMDVGDRLQYLEDKIVAACRDLLHCDNFVVRVLERETNRLEAVLATGLVPENRDLAILAEPEGNGISGYVAATGKSYICPDTAQDPLYLPGIENARSSLTVPVELRDEVVGILNIESDKLAAFTDHDRQFAEILARHIAIALHILELLAVERHTATGQVAADVDAELTMPLNDIVRDVTALIEDYRHDPALRERLKLLIDDVDRVKKAMHSVTSAQSVVGLVREPDTLDPLLEGKRILIADDEDIIRETISDVLSKFGAITVMASDGLEAIAMLRSQHFDLVVSDIKMPNRNGYEVFAAARETNAACPVVLTTGFGYDPHHAIVRASKEGLAGVLFKPFKVEQLIDEVRHALAEHGG